VAIEVDRDAPFGTCPTTGSIVGGLATSAVEIGSTAGDQTALMGPDPQAHWPRLAWVTAP
jgi:hypothetical protein